MYRICMDEMCPCRVESYLLVILLSFLRHFWGPSSVPVYIIYISDDVACLHAPCGIGRGRARCLAADSTIYSLPFCLEVLDFAKAEVISGTRGVPTNVL